MFAEGIQVGSEDVISEVPVEQTMPLYVGGALGSLPSVTSEPEPAPAPAPLGPSEAEHLAVYLRRMDEVVGKLCARIGLSREELRAGVTPEPEREVTPEERHEVGELSHGLANIEALVGPEDENAVHIYAEWEVLRALAVVGREIEAEELPLWLSPSAREVLRLEDCRAALERLAARHDIRSRTLLCEGGAVCMRFGDRTFYFLGCGYLRPVYAARLHV